ncbi:MAG: SDR family NAD(P)-dependent oxidoreductase [Pseudomonadota bacterium]
MITRILSSRLPVMITNPTRVFSINFFSAVSDAGALPVLDTEFMTRDTILEHVDQLMDTRILFGVRLASFDPALVKALSQRNPANLDLLVIALDKDEAPFEAPDFTDTRLALEIRDINMTKSIEALDPHALILKGNEAGGRVSRYSSFILMQWYLKHSHVPVFIHGGVGRHTAAGMFAAGVCGVVLDSQVWLSHESPVADNFKTLLKTIDENDSLEITTDPGHIFRVFAKLGTRIAKELKQNAILLAGAPDAHERILEEIRTRYTTMDNKDAVPVQSLFFLGQDGLFAKNFAKPGTAIRTMVADFVKTIGTLLDRVDRFDPIRPGSELAREHGTRLPLIQGPMANISDNAAFAIKVLEAGALPFFAVGSLPEFLADPMLKQAKDRVKTFGAGLVGIEAFNPSVNAHLALVKKYRAPFALFAGGVPSQVTDLEKAGTKTYLHTPSLSMLDNARKNGCTRFIFEGKEAGGHIGSLSSLVLWEAAIASILEDKTLTPAGLTLVFAGGISTCHGSHFISGIASTLAEKGIKIGIQVGTAYLFTQEIVDSGSVKKLYQDIIAEYDDTMVIGQSVGLASRTAPTEFARMMIRTEQEMIREKKSLEDRKRTFEKKNIGSLLIGAKGFLPDFKRPGPENYTWFEGDEHREKGNFLVGDSLAFFRSARTIPDIHTMFFDTKADLFTNLAALEILWSETSKINDEIAVIGMGCILPGAGNPEELWDSILAKRYAIREMPESRMRRDLYYAPDKDAEDRSYTLLAGLLEDYSFDGERFGYDEIKAAHLSRSQQILLEATCQAVANAGYLDDNLKFRTLNPERVSVIIATCLGNELGNDLQFKYHYPEVMAMLEKTDSFNRLDPEEKQQVTDALRLGMEGGHPGYDPVHGILLNIEASRVARHLGARGANYIVDAACASSFTAIDAAMAELLSGEADQVVVGGVNTHLAPESFVGFSKMGALSAKGSFPFDQRADGFVLGEGSAVFVLKRMKDAIRDNDTILGVIKGIGSSSDGRGKAIAAPNPEGQALALQRCFASIRTGLTPSDIRFVEAHGTSTIMGDQAELATLKTVYTGEGRVGVSSIKSQIGHLLGSAGAAGLVKALLAINKGVLPPSANFKTLSSNHDLTGSPLYIIAEPEPWEEENGRTRKAGISSYGFGGINYHMVVEQYTPEYTPLPRTIFADPGYDFNNDRIVIAGIGVRLPGAADCNDFWSLLQSGEKQLSSIPEERFCNRAYAAFDKKSDYRLPLVKAGVIKDLSFNNARYRIPPKTVRSIERGQLLGLIAADEAISSSGLADQITKGNRIGVILGTIPGERQTRNILRVRKGLIEEIIKNADILDPHTRNTIAGELVAAIRERIPENTEDTTPGLLSNIISGRIANHFGLNGANYVVDASCASSVIAIRNAARSVAFKDLDFVLAGGVDANLYPAVLMAFKRLGLLSESDCRFFDSRADGYVMGEGAAIHVITTWKKATDAGMTILGEIVQCSVKSSAPDHLLAPSEQAFVSTINHAYRASGIRKKDINHLDLFAFSNILGDMIEKQVVEKCFHHPLSCGNVKAQFGYFKAANPAVVLAKLMLMNARKTLLPDFNYSEDHSTLKTSSVLKPPRETTHVPDTAPLRLATNVNGIGGNHCHMIVSTLPARLAAVQADRKVQGLPARTTMAKTADNSRVPAAAASRNQDQPLVHLPVAAPGKQRLVALLSGQGAQRPGMMKALFDADADIRNVMLRGEEIFKAIRGYSLLDIMFGNDKRLDLTENTQCAVFLSSAAIHDRLQAQGFNPDFFIGHSVGEYTALFCSGMLGFDDAMKLIIKRSDLMREAALKHPGKIMVVFRNEKETSSLIREATVPGLYITNKNSENQTAVSGDAQAIDNFCTSLASRNVVYKKLNLSGAFHTPLFMEAAEKLREYLAAITFNEADFTRVISNVTGAPYPENRRAVKDLLAKQITSPVEFIRSVEGVYQSGSTHFIEIGPSRLLCNLLKNINIAEYQSTVTVDVKQGEVESFSACRRNLESVSSIFTRKTEPARAIVPLTTPTAAPAPEPETIPMDEDFTTFKEKNMALTDRLLFEEFKRRKRQAAIEAVERFEFNTEKIVISGVSVGLPGKGRRVFAQDNFDRILEGTNFIEPLSLDDQLRITDKNITRLFKQPDGNARFVEITRTEDVIHLAGQLGYFDLNEEYGIKNHYDISMALAVGAGIEALKDAGIPLVMQYKAASNGGRLIPDGFALPQAMQAETGVIITSLFPNNETLITELEKYFYSKLFLKPYEEFEAIYYFLMENIKTVNIKEQLTDWFFRLRQQKRTDLGPYTFDRNFLANACPLGGAFLAQVIRAKGPNTLMSSACASTTQAIGVAEDWIRVGRCKRVLVIGGENATSPAQNQWIGSGFLALGAATVKKRVSEAAKPFDTDRNGTILGSGAVGIVVEAESGVRARGMNGQAEILGTHMANSAFHTFNIDVPHMAHEMDRFVSIVEKRHALDKNDYADKLLFMSHETYTPARGGSADAEVTALKTTFKNHLSNILISNTKGFTGHTLGAAIEDVVMVKALQKHQAPPIANLKSIPDHFRELHFSSRSTMDAEYGLHLAAGFGSHFAFLFVKRIQENAIEGNAAYTRWLVNITGSATPELKIIDNTLCVVQGTGTAQPADQDQTPEHIPAKTPAEEGDRVQAAALPQARAPQAPPVTPAIPAPDQALVPPQAPAAMDAGPAILETLKTLIAEQTGYTTDMLEAELDLEADLGIDTVKQVEIFGKAAGHFGFQVPEDLKLRDLNTIAKLAAYVAVKAGAAAASASQAPVAPTGAQALPGARAAGAAATLQATSVLTDAGILDEIKAIIAEQTGYTPDMLEAELDLEADLGIDTVKQVEIFGKAAGHFGFQVPEDLKLRDLNTITKLAAYVAVKAGAAAAPASQAPAAPGDSRAVSNPQTSGETAFVTAPTSATAPSDSDVLNAVRAIIADQTGYTPDMLDPDLDLEADLGIDTVKQVEIFGKAAGHFGFQVPEDLKLRDLNTIAKLAAYVAAKTGKPAQPESQPQVTVSQSQEPVQAPAVEPEHLQEEDLVPVNGSDLFPDPSSPIKRLVVRTLETTLPDAATLDFSGKTLLVTLDSHGFAREIITLITGNNGTVITLGTGKDADLIFDCSDIASAAERLEKLKPSLKTVNGFLHLAPLDHYFASGKIDDAQVNATIKSAFVIIKSLFDQLGRPQSLIATLAFDSVVFPYMDGCGPIHPAFAGLAGLLKTANKELKNARTKIIDMSGSAPKKQRKAMARAFAAELMNLDAHTEIGYRDKRRWVLSMKPSLARREKPIIPAGSTLLVTGGAGGITYEIIKSVVKTYKTHLVILDVNDIFSLDSRYMAPDLRQPGIMALLKQDMPAAKPLELKQRTERILRARQSVANIETLKAMGVQVDYHVTDVTDYDAVKKAVDAHPVIDGIFHAAGLEMSQFIPKKELKAFELVVDVKIKGLTNLLKAMEGRDYGYAITFSSVTARFGNEGQADYTAANDFLGKALFREKQLHPERTYKVYAWTAWSGVGMATNPTVMQVLKERGIQFLPMDQGVKFFMADLLDRQESEMVFSGLDYSFDRDGLLGDPADTEFPFLDIPVSHNGKSITFARTLDLERDLFLKDHCIEDVPLFLGSTGIETLAEAAASLAGDRARVVELTDFSIPYGIKILKGRPKELTIHAERIDPHVFNCTITSQFKNPKGIVMGDPTLHYQGRCVVSDKPVKSKTVTLPEFRPVTLDSDLSDIVYHPKRLFMNGLFGTIVDINSFDGTTLVTTVKDFSNREFFKGVTRPRLKTPAVIVDAMFQTGGLLEFFTTSITVLPYRIRRITFFQTPEKHREYLCITTRTESGDETNTYQLKLTDRQGNLFIEVEDFQMVKLNTVEEPFRVSHMVHY